MIQRTKQNLLQRARSLGRQASRAAFSFRGRLSLVFGGLLLLMLSFSTLYLVLQNRAVQETSESAVRQSRLLDDAMELRKSLSRLVELDPEDQQQLLYQKQHFNSILNGLRQYEDVDSKAQAYLIEVDRKFLTYLAELGNREELEELRKSVDDYLDLKREGVYASADELQASQKESLAIAIILLSLFTLIFLLAAFRSIRYATRPIRYFASYLDNVSVDGTSGPVLPNEMKRVPEFQHVAKSFDSLIKRLQGYQHLNIRRLLLEKRRSDIIAASISDGIFLLRGEEIVHVNPVGERILNMDPGENWKGLNVSRVKQRIGSSPEERKALKEKYKGVLAIASVLNSTIPVELEIESDDRKFYFLLQKYPISEELIEQVEHSIDSPVDQFLDRWQANTVVVARDVTLVKESQEAKSHFIATLSHEVKTPVTSLTMATRLLKKSLDQVPSPTHRTLIETCAEDVDRLRVLIDDLLSVSRFDTLTEKVQLKDVNLGKLLKQSVQHFQPHGFEKGVEISWKVEGDLKEIIAPVDATKISWALSNLILNALRHTPKGGRVEAVVGTRDGQARVSIRDHGPGINKLRQEKIFERFSSFYDLRVGRSGNAGMGLAIAREIIAAHGGKIWVVSEPGAGAEFCFTLPIHRPETSSSSSLDKEPKGDNSGTLARG